MPSRRSLLALLAGLAGCSGRVNPTPEPPTETLTPAPTPTPRPSPSPTPKPETTLGNGHEQTNGATTLTPRLAGIRRSFFYETEAREGYDVAGGWNERYVFVSLLTEGPSPPEVADLQLTLDDEAYHATRDPDNYSRRAGWRRLDAFGRPYIENVGGWVCFPVPAGVGAERGRFRWLGPDGWTEWALEPQTLDRLNRPLPPIESEVDLTQSVAPDEPLRVGLDLTNHGETADTFRVAVNFSFHDPDPVRPRFDAERAALRVSPDAGLTTEVTYTEFINTGTDEVRVEVVTEHGRTERVVEIEASTPTQS